MDSSSIEEEKLIQMVQDFIESRSPSPISHTCSKVLPFDHHPTYITLQGILGSVTSAEIMVLKRVMKYFTNVKCERRTGSLRRWLVMKLNKDGFLASLCKTKNTWISTLDFAGCDYEYIDIVMKDKDDGPRRLIVDLDFKSQFELARPTSNYKHLLETLPSIFVGNEDKLLNLVSILCSAAKQSLKENGLHIPPWRKTSYMQSKWISSKSTAHQHKDGKVNSKVAKVGDEDQSAKNVSTKWSPPKIMPKRRDFGGGSALTSQFSNMSINCC